MTEIKIPIPARLKNVAKGGHVAGAEDIIDDALNKEQNVINQETLSRLDTVQQKVDDIGDSIQFDEDGDLVTVDGSDFSDDTARGKIPTVGAVLDGLNDGVYDVSKRNPTGGPNSDGKFTLEYILDNANTLIPTGWRHGGMTISFVDSSDNKYVQFRLMADEFSTTESDWQGVDDEPTVGSENLVKSNGVINYLKPLYGNIVEGYAIISGVQTPQIGYMITLNIPVEEGDSVVYKGGFYGGSGGELVSGCIAAYQSNGTNIDWWTSGNNARTITIPANTSYIVATFKIGSDYILKVNNVDVVENSIINTVNSNKYSVSILSAKIKKIDNVKVLDKSILATQGYYARENGAFYSTTQNYYCAKLERDDAQSIIIKSNYNNYGYEGVVFLDSLNNYIAGYQVPSTYKLIQVPDNCGYICYSFVPEDGFNVFVYNYKIYSDDSAAAAFVKSSRESSNINFVNGERYEVTGDVGDTATISKASSQTMSSAMINVNVGDVYVITAQGSAAIRPYTLLDSLDVIQETSAGGEIVYQKYVYVKKNGRLIINSLNAYDGVTFPKEIKKYSNHLLQSKLQGKRIALFGDSITAMVDSNGKGIAEYMEEITGASVLRCGIGGLALQDRGSTVPPVQDITMRLQCYCHLDYAHSIPKIVEGDMEDINIVWSMLKNTYGETPTPQEELAMQNWNNIDFDNIDIVIMSAGTNGFKSKVGNDNGNIGTDDSDTIYTYKGAVNIIVESLLTAYPHLTIFFFTPIVRNVSLGTNPQTYEWSDDYVANTEHEPTLDPAFASGVSLPDVCDAIKDICTKNHVSVCDMYNTMSWTRYNFASYSDDGTHPIRGFKEMAEKYSAFIISNLNR